MLPIFIGIWEGMALLRELNRTASQRPMLHDLIYNLLQGFQARLDKVVIDAISEGTYFAQLHIVQQELTMVADARPSDALALALRFQAPIYVAEVVLETAGKRGDYVAEAMASRPESPSEPLTSEDIQSWLENIRPEDFADPQL